VEIPPWLGTTALHHCAAMFFIQQTRIKTSRLLLTTDLLQLECSIWSDLSSVVDFSLCFSTTSLGNG